jgi:ribonucleoside-diphosphate reductase alpha chain
MAGEFILVNKYLVKDLQEIGLWTQDIKNHIIVHDGSVQNIDAIPKEIRERYKTVWECKMRSIIDMAADRGAFVDQSQSMNLYVENPDLKKLTAMHFHAWNRGVKTGMYYLRSKAKSQAQKFTIDPRLEKQLKEKTLSTSSSALSLPSQEDVGVCEACSA